MAVPVRTRSYDGLPSAPARSASRSRRRWSASSVEERLLLQSQRSFAVVRELASRAEAAFVGVGNIGWQSPMHRDHFVTDQEITELIERGAVGEIAGWAYDGAGRVVDSSVNDRNAALPLSRTPAYADDWRQR